jgi:metal-responsive CopG/Arc/MetJ family transcriptional regulator
MSNISVGTNSRKKRTSVAVTTHLDKKLVACLDQFASDRFRANRSAAVESILTERLFPEQSTTTTS